MPGIDFIDCKGKKILYMDFSNCTAEELPVLVGKAIEIISKQSEKSLLVLINVVNAPAERGTSSLIQSFASHNRPFIKAAAIVGVDVKTEPILNKAKVYSEQEINLFATLDEAKEWLTQHE